MNKKHYPFHDSLKAVLRSIDGASIGIRLIQGIMESLDITQSEAEVLSSVASYRKPATFISVCEDVIHLTPDTVKRCLLSLTKDGHVFTQSIIDHDGFLYTAGETAKATLKSFTKDALEHLSPVTYTEAIVKPKRAAPVTKPDPVITKVPDPIPVVKDEPKPVPTPVPEVVTHPTPVSIPRDVYPVFTPGFNAALDFCYRLLAPATDANTLLEINSVIAHGARREIFNARPHSEDYNEMMKKLYPKGIPAPGPIATPRLGLFATLLKAARDWFDTK